MTFKLCRQNITE